MIPIAMKICSKRTIVSVIQEPVSNTSIFYILREPLSFSFTERKESFDRRFIYSQIIPPLNLCWELISPLSLFQKAAYSTKDYKYSNYKNMNSQWSLLLWIQWARFFSRKDSLKWKTILNLFFLCSKQLCQAAAISVLGFSIRSPCHPYRHPYRHPLLEIPSRP